MRADVASLDAPYIFVNINMRQFKHTHTQYIDKANKNTAYPYYV